MLHDSQTRPAQGRAPGLGLKWAATGITIAAIFLVLDRLPATPPVILSVLMLIVPALFSVVTGREIVRLVLALIFRFRIFGIRIGDARAPLARRIGGIDVEVAALPIIGSVRAASRRARHHRLARACQALGPLVVQIALAIGADHALDRIERVDSPVGLLLAVVESANVFLLLLHLLVPFETFSGQRSDIALALDLLRSRREDDRAQRAHYYAWLMATALARNAQDEAHQHLEDARKQLGSEALLLGLAARLAESEARLEDAVRLQTEAVRAPHRDPHVAAWLATERAWSLHFHEGANALTRSHRLLAFAESVTPFDASCLGARAAWLLGSGEIEAARLRLEAALSAATDPVIRGRLLVALAQCAARSEEHTEALQWLEKARSQVGATAWADLVESRLATSHDAPEPGATAPVCDFIDPLESPYRARWGALRERPRAALGKLAISSAPLVLACGAIAIFGLGPLAAQLDDRRLTHLEAVAVDSDPDACANALAVDLAREDDLDSTFGRNNARHARRASARASLHRCSGNQTAARAALDEALAAAWQARFESDHQTETASAGWIEAQVRLTRTLRELAEDRLDRAAYRDALAHLDEAAGEIALASTRVRKSSDSRAREAAKRTFAAESAEIELARIRVLVGTGARDPARERFERLLRTSQAKPETSPEFLDRLIRSYGESLQRWGDREGAATLARELEQLKPQAPFFEGWRERWFGRSDTTTGTASEPVSAAFPG